MSPTFLRVSQLVSSHDVRWSLAIMLIGCGSCTVPRFEGPQIQDPPDAFFMQPDTHQQRRMFPAHEVVHHNAWINTSWGEFSTIYINGHPGQLGRGDVQRALGEARALTSGPVTFGDIESLRIDGQPAWGWAERLETQENGLEWIAYRVAIQYDTVTYAVELFSGDPTFKRQPDTLRAVAATFAVGETRWNVPLIAVLLGVGFLAFKFVRSRTEQKNEQMRHVTLVTIKKQEKEDEEEGTEDTASAGPEAGAAAPVQRAPLAGGQAAASRPTPVATPTAGPARTPTGVPAGASSAAPSSAPSAAPAPPPGATPRPAPGGES